MPDLRDLAVVVVNFNTGEYLSRCMESIHASAGDVRFEVVVVDNASSDDSPDRALEGRLDVRLIRNPGNRGFARAANHRIAATSAPSSSCSARMRRWWEERWRRW